MSDAGKKDDYVRQGEFDAAMTAIKADFNRMDERFDGLEQRFDGLEQRFDGLESNNERLERIMKATLQLVQDIDRKLSVLPDHEERIERLEDRVFAGK